MARTKNMGLATVKFNEGVIISGSAGSDTHALIITGTAHINGDITCNNISIGADSAGAGKTISAGNTDTRIEFSNLDKIKFFVGGVNMFECDENISQDMVTINQGGNDIDFRVETDNKQHVIYTDAAFDLLVLGSDQAMPPGLGSDTNIFISGSNDGQGRTVFGGEVVISGSLYGNYRQITYNKFNRSDNNEFFPRFNSNGSNTSAGENNIFLAPANGKLKYAVLRTRLAAGNTSVAFHKANTGTTIANTGFDVEVERVEVSSLAAETSYKFKFTDAASFNFGDVLGISINPSNNPDNGNITCVWEFDFID